MSLQTDSMIAEVEMWHLWLPVAHLYMCATGRLCTLHDNPLSAQASWPCKVGWQQVSRSEAILMFGWSMALVYIKKGYSWQNCSLTYWSHSTDKSPASHLLFIESMKSQRVHSIFNWIEAMVGYSWEAILTNQMVYVPTFTLSLEHLL